MYEEGHRYHHTELSHCGFLSRYFRGAFDDIAEIFTYSLDNGTLRELKECDLYVRAVTSYDLIHYSWAEPYFPPEERTVYMDLTFFPPRGG